MQFKFGVGKREASVDDPAKRLVSVLAERGLSLVPSKCRAGLAARAGQAMSGCFGMPDMDVEDRLRRFCAGVLSKNIAVPVWVANLVYQNKEWIAIGDSAQDGRFNVFLLTVISFVFSVKISVYAVENVLTRTAVFGEHNYASIKLLIHNNDFHVLCTTEQEDTAFHVPAAKNCDIGPNSWRSEHFNETRIGGSSQNMLSRGSHPNTAPRKGYPFKLEHGSPLAIIDQRTFARLRQIKATKAENLLSATYKQLSVTHFRSRAISSAQERISSIQSLHVQAVDNGRKSAFKPALKMAKGFAADITNTYNAKGQTSFETALKFIETYQSSYKIHLRDFIEQREHRLDNNGLGKMHCTGVLKFYNEDKKFGFIQPQRGHEVFLHKDSLVKSKIDSRGLELCAQFFDISMEFQCLHYEGKSKTAVKAVDIVLSNFVPKSAAYQ